MVVGNTVKVTFTVSSSSPLGSWFFDVQYDSSKLSYVSSTLEGSTRATGYATNNKTKTKTYTMTFKAKSSGTATISVRNMEIAGWDEKLMSPSSNSLKINIITQKQLEDSYSSNNNLKSLSVDGYDLSPVFSKNTLEYSLELENDIRSIKVNATKEDSRASLKGGGVYSLQEGQNDIVITDKYAIATHDDKDFWIADDETWFAAGTARPSPVAAAKNAAAAHGLRPVLYLAQSNIMDLDARRDAWRADGVLVISDPSELN